MTLVDFLMFVCTCVGTTSILVTSVVFEPIRNFVSERSDKLGYLLSCSMCSGFWVGLIVAYILDFPLYEGAVASSLFSWIVVNVVSAFYSVSEYFESMLVEEDE